MENTKLAKKSEKAEQHDCSGQRTKQYCNLA